MTQDIPHEIKDVTFKISVSTYKINFTEGKWNAHNVIDGVPNKKAEIKAITKEALFKYLADAEYTDTDKVKEKYEKAKKSMEEESKC